MKPRNFVAAGALLAASTTGIGCATQHHLRVEIQQSDGTSKLVTAEDCQKAESTVERSPSEKQACSIIREVTEANCRHILELEGYYLTGGLISCGILYDAFSLTPRTPQQMEEAKICNQNASALRRAVVKACDEFLQR